MPSKSNLRLPPAAGEPAAGQSDPDPHARAFAAVRLRDLCGGVLVLRAVYHSQRFSRHAHEGYALGVIESGALAFRYRGERLVAPAGQVSLAQPDIPHDGAPAGGAGWGYRMLYLPPQAMTRILPRRAGLPFFRPGVLDAPDFAAAIAATHALLLDPAAPALAKETRFLDLLAAWVARYAERTPVLPPPGPEPQAVRRILEFMDAHWDEDISLTHLARITGLSPWHLVRVMTRATGLPPHAHLLERRCRAARDMLDGQARLADIAAATGFADQSHLTRAFRARFGLTPGAYRKIVQNSTLLAR